MHAQHHLPLVGELQRVAQKIDQDLHQTVAVGADPFGHAGVHLAAVSQVHAFDPRRKQIKGVLYRVTQSESFGVRSQTPRQELRVVQHIVDDRHQVIGRLTRMFQNFLRSGFVLHPLDQQTVEAQNRIHGRAKLMADGGNKVLAHLLCLLQFSLFFLQLLLPQSAFA